MVLLFWRPFMAHGIIILCNEFCSLNFSSPSSLHKGQRSWLCFWVVSFPAPLCSQTAIICATLSVVTDCLLSVVGRLCAKEPPQSFSALLFVELNKPSCGSLILLTGTYPMMKEVRSWGRLILCHQVVRRLVATISEGWTFVPDRGIGHEGPVLWSNSYTTLPLGVGDIPFLLLSTCTAATEKISPLQGVPYEYTSFS